MDNAKVNEVLNGIIFSLENIGVKPERVDVTKTGIPYLRDAEKQAQVRLTMRGGEKVRFKAVRVATRHVRIRGFQS